MWHFLGVKVTEQQLVALEQVATERRQTRSQVVRAYLEAEARRRGLLHEEADEARRGACGDGPK